MARRLRDWAIITLALSALAFGAAIVAMWEILTLPFRPWLNWLHREGRL
jgi:hypothetical protein